MRRGTILVPVAALVVALGCDEDDVVGDGTVIGRVDATTQPFAATVPVASAARAPFRFAARGVVALPRDATARLDAAGPVALRQVGPGTAAATVAIGRFARDGDLRVFVLGDVGADARFRVTGVPAGLTRLIAEVRDEAGAAIGRSIIHIGPGVGEVVPVAAIDGETTAEANVLAALIASGTLAPRIATPDLAAKLEFSSDGEARAAAVSESAIQALAAAFLAAQTAFLETFRRFGSNADAGDLQIGGAAAALLYAALRDQGVDEPRAEQSFLSALAEGYDDIGLGFEPQSVAGSAAAAAGVAATADASARLTLLRGATTQMAAARALLAILALTALGASTADAQLVSEAFVDFDADAGAATSVAGVLAAAEAFRDALLAVFTTVATTRLGLSASVVANLIQSAETAPFQAALAASLAAATDIDDIVDAYLDFYDALRDLVVGTLTAAGLSLANAELAADVFVAADMALAAIFA